MTRRILVTAATGTVGGAAMRLLAGDAKSGEFELIGAARSARSADRLRAEGFAPVTFDYDRPETLRPALEGVDSVFLITGYSVDMLIHSKRLLDAAKAAGVRHIVHLGALAPDDTPHPHFAWHQLIEHTIESMGFSFTHLRPNFFIDTVWAGFKHRPDRLVHFVGDRKISWISSEDIAAVGTAALRDPDRHSGKTYPLAVEALSLTEIATLLSEVTHRPVEYRPREPTELLPILLKQGMDPVYATSLAGGVAAIEAGNMPLADAVYDTVKSVTGRMPLGWRAFAEARKGELTAS
ncbi:NmrA family NAD(P)-binding protein [Microvirga flavescens]|uniref:NmrA family NAD(P)-binding protein n=1 Tax=Microvirga flavescens TaxID=2249811 RepID=UPI000DD9A774|nr:NmrA family NAD(P)-binding protein [Microvirga flavescens]